MKYSILSSAIFTALFFTSQVDAANVSGKITDTANQPIEGAQVSIKGTNKKVFTDENGQYQITNVQDGHIHVHVASQYHVHGDQEFDDIDNVVANFALAPSSVENIVVTASSLRTSVLESVTPVSVLSSEELRKKQAPTLGETLKSLPGVHSTYFGPVASSPIIRGNDGPRVKLVQNGLDVSDASRVGPDHNIGSDAATATQIEVLRGPATLQFGSGAIGGVVNVVDQRIPTQLYSGIEGETELRHETASDEKFAKIDLSASAGNVSFHLDGFDRSTNDVDVPGFAALEPTDEDVAGSLASSAIDSDSVTAGISYISDKGYIGASIQEFNNLYGIPGPHEEEEEEEHEEGEEEEGVSLDVDYTRYQLAGELFTPFKGVNSIKLLAGYTDYQHVELEGEEFGTLFENDTSEIKLTLEHDAIAGWHGVVGVNYSSLNYSALGEEAFTPPSETDTFALFLVEEKKINKVNIELGARIESVDLSADSVDIGEEFVETFSFPELSYTNLSLSAGINWQYKDGHSLAVSVSRSERAPSHQELFSAGVHLSTQTFDLGAFFEIDDEQNIVFRQSEPVEEVATNLDITWRKYTGDWGFTFSTFYNQVDDFLYQADTGLTFEEFPILIFTQEDADLYGFEGEVHVQLNEAWRLQFVGDYIRAEVDSGDLPRIPPLKLSAELGFDYGNFYGDITLTGYDNQSKVADLETETAGYGLLEASINYRIPSAGADWILFAKGTNLTDQRARVHTSFIKDFSLLPGRGLTVGVRTQF